MVTSRHLATRAPATARRRTTVRLVVAGLATAWLVAGAPGALAAQEPPTDGAASSLPVTWGVRPAARSSEPARPNFEFEAAPGETVSDELVVENPSGVNLVLGVYASDAFNTADGGTDLLAADGDPTGVGRWTRPAESSITVPAGGSVSVPFSVEVPDDAEPGDHVGGIVTSLTVAAPDAQGNRLAVERRLGSRIYVRVDGGVDAALTFTQLEIDHHGSPNPFAPGSLTVRYAVENTGNVRLRATRLVRVTPTVGSTRTVEAADMPELLPGNSYEFTQDVPGVWPALSTGVEVELEPYDAGGARLAPAPVATIARTEIGLWPISQLCLVVLLVLAAIALRWCRRSSRSAARAVTPAAPTSAIPPPFPPHMSPDQLGSAGGQLYQGDAP